MAVISVKSIMTEMHVLMVLWHRTARLIPA